MSLAEGAVVGGDYRVERPLAQGGMGAVFVATQLSTDRKRALKVMHATLVGDALSQQRFLEEARVGSQIESEHVVEVVGAGIDEATGAPWLAMELLEGETLADRVARGPLPPAQLASLIRGLRHGLGRAHERGIVHRDLKPENLFIARGRGASGEESLKILDFGIAKLLHGGKTAATQNIAGSPLWMAPEQADAAAIRPATDVWALGLIAFDALVGQPYWRSAADGSTLTRLLVEILTEPLEPASARATALAGPDVAARLPAEFDAFFARAVARDSYDRFDNANDALDALDDVLRGVPMRRFTREVMSAEDALAKTAVSVPPPASHGAGTSPGAAASPASAVSSAPGPFRGTAETQPAPSPLAATHPGGAARSWSGVVAGVVAGVGLAALAGAAWMVRDAGEAPAAQVAAAPLTRPTEEQRAPEGGGRDTGEASAPSRAPTPTTAPGARLDVADPVGHAGASDALAAAAPSGPAPSRVGASAGPGASPHRSGGTPPAARARPQGAEAQRFRSTIIVPCWRDNAPADAAPVSLSVVLGFGGTGNIATVRVDGTHDANVRRCIVMRGTTYRMLEPPTSPTLTVRARLP